MHEANRPHRPTPGEDVTNLSAIALSALVAMTVTGHLLLSVHPDHHHVVEHEIEVVHEVIEEVVEERSVQADDRLFGQVVTRDGDSWTGFLRWNDREASWSDLLPAHPMGSNKLGGLRFGHMASIEAVDPWTFRATLKSGEVVGRSVLPNASGPALSGVQVELEPNTVQYVSWNELDRIEFMPPPSHRSPSYERIHGTVNTQAGRSFTGYIAWDGRSHFEEEGVTHARSDGWIAFSEIESLGRIDDEHALVSFGEGESVMLDGRPAGAWKVVVSDAGLGTVEIPWSELAAVRLHPPEAAEGYASFDGGVPLTGVVTTAAGEEIRGEVRWDLDESADWDMLDGDFSGMQMHVEFSRIERLSRARLGLRVELRDGRTFHLVGSNDVNWNNRGIEVRNDGRTWMVEWEDLRDFRLDPRD